MFIPLILRGKVSGSGDTWVGVGVGFRMFDCHFIQDGVSFGLDFGGDWSLRIGG